MRIGSGSPSGVPRGGFDAALLKTGQTTQYDSEEDDGYFEKGIAKSYTVLTTGQYSGTVAIVLNAKTHNLSNECVLDNQTGLMWARYVPNADIGPDNDGKLYWKEVADVENIFRFKDQANAKELGGHSDWRVPNVTELSSLVNYYGSPAIDSVTFPSTPSTLQWTSTTYGASTSLAFTVSFANLKGYAYPYTKATDKNYCRLVRG